MPENPPAPAHTCLHMPHKHARTHIISSLLHHTLETKLISNLSYKIKMRLWPSKKPKTWSICSCKHTSKPCLEIRGQSALPDMPENPPAHVHTCLHMPHKPAHTWFHRKCVVNLLLQTYFKNMLRNTWSICSTWHAWKPHKNNLSNHSKIRF